MTCAIVLAAGHSHRMGKPKALLPFAGSTFIARLVDAFLSAGVDHAIAVIRPGDPAVRAAVGPRPVQFVENPDPAGDMLSSVRCALRALPESTRVVAISPVDQPGLEPALIRALLNAFQSSQRSILVPQCAGRRGHPLVFSSRFADELLTAHDGVGLRGLLQAHPAEVEEWITVDPAVTQDIDTPADYDANRR